MDGVPTVIDPWVARYESLQRELEALGIAPSKIEDRCWLNLNLKEICKDRATGLLKEIDEIHRYYS